MSVWTIGNTSPTKDPRVRVGGWGKGNWRTVVRDGTNCQTGQPEWTETGPPYPSKAVAAGHVDEVLAGYFGEGPSYGELAGRIEAALKLAREYGGTGGAHHKMWVINRMTEELTGGRESLSQRGIAP
jgi:hypothetical protein